MTVRTTWNGKYEIVGAEHIENNVYEMRYVYAFGGKFYKTLNNAIRAINNKGYEYIPNDEITLVCGWN